MSSAALSEVEESAAARVRWWIKSIYLLPGGRRKASGDLQNHQRAGGVGVDNVREQDSAMV